MTLGAAKKRGPTAAALIVGAELLSGKIADQNLVVLAQTLRSLGVTLKYALTVTDDLPTIAREVRRASRSEDWVFTSGGVGPTHDDLTLLGVARAFRKRLHRSGELEQLIRAAYGDAVREGHLSMGSIPECAMLERTEGVPWPAIRVRNVWVLPGVPQVFAMKMRIVSATLQRAARPFSSSALYVRLDEGEIKDALDEVVLANPDVQIGSYPRWGDPVRKTMITFDSRDERACAAARDALVRALPADSVVAAP